LHGSHAEAERPDRIALWAEQPSPQDKCAH